MSTTEPMDIVKALFGDDPGEWKRIVASLDERWIHGSKMGHVSVRLPAPVLEGLDKVAEAMRTLTPWRRVSRSEAVRLLIVRALDRAGANNTEKGETP